MIRQAVVLAGGLGSRLGSLTTSTPKPLLPVAGRPFLDYQIEWLARAGFEHVILATGYLADAFDAFVFSRTWRGPTGRPVIVETARESHPAGTGGAVALVRERLDPRFLLVNGDTFFDCDLVSVERAAKATPSDSAMLTVRRVVDTSRYGRVEVGSDGRVLRFAEKGVGGAGTVNAGVAVLARSITEMIKSLPCSIETEIYPDLANQDRLYTCEQEGFFIDIGVPDAYTRAQAELPKAAQKPAFFFDRDGVLNVDGGYTHRTEDLELMPGAAAAVRLVRDAGYVVVVVTNQAGVARGFYNEDAVGVFNDALNARLREEGGWIDAFYFCPYHPEGSEPAYRCAHPERKPAPGMILRAAEELGLDLGASYLIGDKQSDLEAARAAGIGACLFQGGRLDSLVRDVLAFQRALPVGSR